jgi:heme oxygenase (mycobilin-producing)
MAVKIIITRNVKPDQEAAIRPLLLEMRSHAMEQTGYISGETLINYDNPEEHLVISTWKTIEDWNQWLKSDKRAQLQGKVDHILNHSTVYRVFYNG